MRTAPRSGMNHAETMVHHACRVVCPAHAESSFILWFSKLLMSPPLEAVRSAEGDWAPEPQYVGSTGVKCIPEIHFTHKFFGKAFI